MTEDTQARIEATQREILTELRSLRELIKQALAMRRTGAPGGELLLAEEAAAMLRIKKETLLAGKAGTHVLLRQSKRPATYLLSDIKSFIRQRAEQRKSARERSVRKYEKRLKAASGTRNRR